MPVNPTIRSLASDGRLSQADAQQLKQAVQSGQVTRAEVQDAAGRYNEAMEPEACVSFATEWAMACPGLGTWCESEAPRLVMQCMASRDRTLFCTATGDATGSTEFGYDDCARLREDVDGTYAKRSHKKFCGAAFRAVAEHCRRGGAVP